MKNRPFSTLLKFIATFQLIIFNSPAVSCPIFPEKADDGHTYLGFNQFGTIGQSNSGEYDNLDSINEDLARRELDITKAIQKNKKSKAKNNIALGSLTVILKNNEPHPINVINKELTYYGQEDCDQEEKLRIFESTLISCNQNNSDLSKEYYFEKTLNKIPELIGHINEIWGALGEHSEQETQIWNDFQAQQVTLWESKENLKNLIIQAALTNYGQDLSELARRFTVSERNNSQEQAEILRDCVVTNKKGKTPAKLLEDMAKRITDHQASVKKSETSFENAVSKFYRSYWHSEQRLIHFLLSSDAFWEPLLDEISIKDTTKSVEILLHLHSRYNLCPTCKCSLSQAAVKKNGILWKKIHDKLGLQEGIKFSFKVLASFRVHYNCQSLIEPTKEWVPHKVVAPEKTIYDYNMEETPSLYLKKIWMGDTEEKSDEIKYSNAWKRHLEEKYSKAEQSMALEELGKYKMDWVLYINSLISNLESRIEILENKMKS